MNILEELKRPFPVKSLRWRQGGGGKELVYIDARQAVQRLDEVMGTDWQCRYSHVGDHGVICEIGLKINDEWVWRSDGSGETKIEAEKGAMSRAFVRTCARWGLGAYLYSLKDKNNIPDWATPEGYDALLEKRKEEA